MAAPYLLLPDVDEIDAAGQDGTKSPAAAASAATMPLFYTFCKGGVRIVVLNTDAPYRRGSEQYRWLRRQMQEADSPAGRSECPWLIVLMHRPLYSVAPWYENTREAGTCEQYRRRRHCFCCTHRH